MDFIPDTPDSEDYYNFDEPRTERTLAAITILLVLSPFACSGMFGPMWASTSSEEINHWYDRMEALGAGIFLFGPPLLVLVNRMHRWFWRGILRWIIIAVQWGIAGIFAAHLSDPWRPVVISDWQSRYSAVIEHPIFSGCFYLSALLSCILWITFRGDRRWFLRVLYEILPFPLATAGLYYLSIADRPEFTWG